jgi:hypothetical protein
VVVVVCGFFVWFCVWFGWVFVGGCLCWWVRLCCVGVLFCVFVVCCGLVVWFWCFGVLGVLWGLCLWVLFLGLGCGCGFVVLVCFVWWWV